MLCKPRTVWIDRRGQGIRLTGALISRSQSPCVCTHAPTNFSLCFQYVSNTKALQFFPNDGSPMVRIMPLQPVPVHLCCSWVRVLTCRRANVHMNLHGSKLCKPYIKVSSIEQHDQLHGQSSVSIALRNIRGETILDGKEISAATRKLINECFQFHCVEFVQMACNCQTELKSGVIEKKVKQSSHMSNLGQCHGVPAFLFCSWPRQRKRKEKYYSDRMDEFNISMQSYFCMERINELGKCNILIFSPNHHTSKYLDQVKRQYHATREICLSP